MLGKPDPSCFFMPCRVVDILRIKDADELGKGWGTNGFFLVERQAGKSSATASPCSALSSHPKQTPAEQTGPSGAALHWQPMS